MLKKYLTKLFSNRTCKRRVGRRSVWVRQVQLERLEDRQLLTANIATGYGTNQFVEDIASDFGGKVVDINGDGALDVIGDTVHIRNGGGWLTYANGPGVGTLVDIDGDNDLDVVRGRHWVENLGGGTSWLQHEVATVASGVVHVSSDVADFDRDGDMDIVISRESKIHWFENVNGDASTWTEHTVISGSPFDFVATAAGDMDNDGDMDVVVSANDYVILWLENLGRGAFVDYFYNQIGSTADDGRVYTSASTLNVGDFDQDGRTDVIAVDT
ncbi:MAG: VCBS repeat-containing protein, partial [Planctomycetaceae bacterium]|nr:VCBS repeat-containing protein [Planctomycetaceae bacterium]